MQNLYFDWKTSNALHKIESMNSIHSLRIATAFIEQQGVNWIKNIVAKHGLSKDHVEVYLSVDFSFNQPSVLLEQLTEVADTYIVTKQKLHAKVILAVDKVGTGKVMHGSANLTNMGIYHNLELSTVLDVTAPTHSNILMFFERLGDLATYAEPMIIEGYRKREEIISNGSYAFDSGDTIFKPVFKSKESNQLPSEDALADFYFQHEDYETLLEENAPLVTQELHQQRINIRNKLLVLHDKIEAFTFFHSKKESQGMTHLFL